jgi:hypothetical protein
VRLWSRIVVLIRGKQIGVLGQRAVGKTFLQTFLREGELPKQYRATVASKKLPPARPKLRGEKRNEKTKVAIRTGADVPGDSATNTDEWRELTHEVDVLLYLFNVQLLLEGDASHAERMLVDAELVGSFIDERQKLDKGVPKVALVGTHCDLVDGYEPPSSGTDFLIFFSSVFEREEVKRAALLIGQSLPSVPRPVVGSLATDDEAADLAWRVFHQELKL